MEPKTFLGCALIRALAPMLQLLMAVTKEECDVFIAGRYRQLSNDIKRETFEYVSFSCTEAAFERVKLTEESRVA